MSVTLLGNGVFADDHIKMKSLRWALIQQEKICTQRDVHMWRMPHEGKSRYQSDATIHQGTLMIASQLSEASGGVWNRPFPQS